MEESASLWPATLIGIVVDHVDSLSEILLMFKAIKQVDNKPLSQQMLSLARW